MDSFNDFKVKKCKPKNEAHFVANQEVFKELAGEIPEFKPHHIRAIQAIFNLSRDLEKASDLYFKQNHGFSRTRFLTLINLLHCPQYRQNPNVLAQRLNVTRGNMTGLIDSLIEKGFVTKKNDPLDRRQVWIVLTPQGKTYLKSLMPSYSRRIARLMSVLTNSEIKVFTEIANKLHGGIEFFEA